MRTVVANNITPTTNYSDNRVTVRVHPGPISLGITWAKNSATSLNVRVEHGWISGDIPPDVTNDTLWYPPATQAGAADNEVVVTTTGNSFIDLSGRLPASSVGNTGWTGIVPTGVSHLRIAVKGVGTLTSVTATVTLFHNGPASPSP